MDMRFSTKILTFKFLFHFRVLNPPGKLPRFRPIGPESKNVIVDWLYRCRTVSYLLYVYSLRARTRVNNRGTRTGLYTLQCWRLPTLGGFLAQVRNSQIRWNNLVDFLGLHSTPTYWLCLGWGGPRRAVATPGTTCARTTQILTAGPPVPFIQVPYQSRSFG